MVTDLPADALDAVARWLPGQRWFAGKGRPIRDIAFEQVTPLGPGGWNTTVAVTLDTGVQLYQVPLALGDGMGAGLRDGTHDAALMSVLLAGAHWVHPPPKPLTYRALNVEQSHSSGVCSETVFVKLYRLLTPGVNPDVEVPVALQGCRQVPPVWGWGAFADGTSWALLQEYLPDAVAGWELAKTGGVDARSLGQTIAGLHADLLRAFRTGAVSGQALCDRLTTRVTAVAQEVPEVSRVLPEVMAQLQTLRRRAAIPVQRIHGDLHLGQVLHTQRGWRVIDFEGEPGAVDRRAPDSVWRDVAAMVRSFDYAGLPAEEFLAGYGRPADRELLMAYLLDKAVYEVAYESRNRPDWVHIPMRALEELAGA